MNEQETKALLETIGKQNTEQITKLMAEQDTRTKALIDEAKKNGGGVTAERFAEVEKANSESLDAVKDILNKQGLNLAELAMKVTGGNGHNKTIAESLYDDKEDLNKIRDSRTGFKEYMVMQKADGTPFLTPHNSVTKAAGPTGTVSGLGGVGGNVASITQSIDAASLLRLGGMAMINGLYRNTQWLFDLVNVIQAGFENPLALWFEETTPQGTAAIVAEGQPKPLVQYAYTLKSATYKKAAQLISYTEEFTLDFARLQSDIMQKARIDVLNVINANLLTDLTTAATTYNTSASFKPGGTGVGVVTNVNDYDAIAAMAAQADNATYGASTNTAIMSTFKKYRMGITKSTYGDYVNRPDVLDNVSFVGNPSMGADNVIVGDLKQMNLILRGGLIVRMGYNADDFARNQFSMVVEQYYFDYIPTVRRPAIVSGPDFATVKTAISS